MRACLVALLLTACGSEEYEPMPIQGIPPWHMWGNQIQVDLVAAATPFTLSTQQLVNINYARPDTWSWIFWYQVVACSSPGGVGVVQARFNLTTGIGRTRLTMADFVYFNPGAGTLPLVGNHSYTTSTPDGETRILSDLPAQDLILNVNSIITGGAAPGTTVSMLVGAMFAPKTHVRPEWYEGRFTAGEDDGH